MKGMSAQKVTEADFEEFDHVIALDQGHYQILERLQPSGSHAKLTLFMDYCEGHDGTGVPDPYYGDADGFEEVLDILEDGVEGMLKQFEM